MEIGMNKKFVNIHGKWLFEIISWLIMLICILFSANTPVNNEETERVNAELSEHLGKLNTDLAELNNKYQSQVADNSQLSRYGAILKTILTIIYYCKPSNVIMTN